ncbi:MBL fold metallo-hydrolase [Synechococcus sp. CBW1006]|uniref:MBL fold metallo-hydrolase n=1 Tax=Synechococcus sp. CBW1006 TaxID=1353138 RepID=UPI0018CE0E64|nr:MBL fold metallo-hydrolase [Synechococcus sp. CBW1006]QPN65530.1 MBL fold metallo-hydrolase [Synechococcus sp. CBW1006]
MAILSAPPIDPGRPPLAVLPGLWCFAPNRDCQGGTAWLLALADGDLLVDCPALSEANLTFLEARPAQGRIVLTSREGHGRVRRLKERLGWPVLVQEQESYLLPNLQDRVDWGEEAEPAPGLRLLWTPGPTPGSCVIHVQAPAAAGLDILFCGRLLGPTAPGRLVPLRTPRTFHWPRQQRSLVRLRQWLPPASPQWIACGGGLGALRGDKLLAGGSSLISELAEQVATAA